MSESYFKRIDSFAKWIFHRNNIPNNPKPEINEPKTLNESDQKSYVEFLNEVQCPSSKKASNLIAQRKAKTERGDISVNSPRYIKKTDPSNTETMGQACTVCLNEEANAVLMDCGHGAICFNCGLILLKTTC